VYGSKYGATKEIAERIGKVLAGNGSEVVVRDAADLAKQDVSGYDSFIIGSNIMMGSWLKPVEKFMVANEKVLAGKKTAVFVCCMDAVDATRVSAAQAKYIDDVLSKFPSVKPVSTAIFAGVVDFNKYGFLIKKIMKSESAKRNVAVTEDKLVYDMRDWKAIEAWASSLSNALSK